MAKATQDERSASVSLIHSRNRHAVWTAVGLGLGTMLILKLGVIAQWVGGLLLVLGILHTVRLVRTLLYPAGTIEVSDEKISLPVGICRAAPLEIAEDGLRHAYFLRRAVPWTRTGPVLVVETGDRVLMYPRDWFTSESDQKKAATALLSRIAA